MKKQKSNIKWLTLEKRILFTDLCVVKATIWIIEKNKKGMSNWTDWDINCSHYLLRKCNFTILKKLLIGRYYSVFEIKFGNLYKEKHRKILCWAYILNTPKTVNRKIIIRFMLLIVNFQIFNRIGQLRIVIPSILFF